MGRIFTFGCSFTDYEWPTWADIILYGNEGYNVGLSGAGNETILYRVMETHRKFNIDENDTIIIMFTNPIRWDYINGDTPKFSQYGQVTTIKELNQYQNKFFTIEGLCYKSYYSIIAIKNFLENNGVKYLFTSMNNLFQDIDSYFVELELSNELIDLMSYVKENVKFEIPSMYSFLQSNGFIKNRNWGITKKWDGYNDYHPRPTQHFEFVKQHILSKINCDLNIDLEFVKNMEKIIDEFNDIKDYLNYNSGIYPSIYDKKIGSQVYMKNIS